MKQENHNHAGVGFFGLLTLLFIALKLLGVIRWSWWFVLAPSYFPLTIVLNILFIYWLYVTISNLRFKKRGKRK